jgi:hypothetical protein
MEKISSGSFGNIFSCIDYKRLRTSAIKVFKPGKGRAQSAAREYNMLLWLRNHESSSKFSPHVPKQLSVQKVSSAESISPSGRRNTMYRHRTHGR